MPNRNELPEPLNAQERLLYAIAHRQDILIEQMNSVIEHLSTRDKVAVTSTLDTDVTPKKRSPRKKVAEEGVE